MTMEMKMEQLMQGSNYDNMGGILVEKDGKVQYEKYLNGCTCDSPFHVFSVTKSVLSILLGIAVDKGYIKSVTQNILEFFPEYKADPNEQTKKEIRLQDLLTMTAPYKYQQEPYEEYFSSGDWVKTALDLLGGPGKIGEFRYCPLIGPDILSGILVRTTGRSVLEFANENLFSKLGITVGETIQFKSKEEQLAFYSQKEKRGWVADPKGVNTAGWGLILTTRDMAKIGQLYLNKGSWDGEQIVSEEWILKSTSVHSIWKQCNLFYGYLWWIIDEKDHAYAAMGDGGNVIYVNEKKGLVIAISSYFKPNVMDRIGLIKGQIEPLFA